MPGPAIRAWQLAEVLGAHTDVVLASTVSVEGTHPAADLRLAYGPALGEMVAEAEACFAPSALVYMADELRSGSKPLAVDIYDPTHLENLESHGQDLPAQDLGVARQVGVLNVALGRGDFFCCASERQRDFWLGSLAALGRVNPYVARDDPTLARFLAVVPFGLPARAPRKRGPALRGVVPGIAPGDKVVLWGGGVYNWLDPASAVKAVGRLAQRVPEVRLVFMGMGHPNPAVGEMATANALRRLSADLGLTGKHVFFNEGWVPYERRADFLLEADVAVSTHLDHLETRYSFRSRLLDCIWAGLPMVLTCGDVLADEVASAGLGKVVPPGDEQQIYKALADLLASPPPRQRFERLARRYRWDVVAAPLVEWCLAPRRAPDLLVARPTPAEAAAR
jgi:glycosyltransferase involved in cell wall biosynthesis